MSIDTVANEEESITDVNNDAPIYVRKAEGSAVRSQS
jgi:hypothetical protein